MCFYFGGGAVTPTRAPRSSARVSQEEQVVPAARARQEGPQEPAEREDAGGPHGAGRQAQAAAHRRGAVPALARRAHGDAQPGQPLLH